MDWKAPGKFFSSLNITGRKMFYISFWSFLHHLKTCKKNFWKILIFCHGFCNVCESSKVLGKEGVTTIMFVPCPCNQYYFTTISQGRSTESFIKISSLVPKIFDILWLKGLHFYPNIAFIGTNCTHEGWICIKMKPFETQNIILKYLKNQ